MRVLVMESDRRAADHAIELLRAAGHEVVRCHERDDPAFPCGALMPGGSCPVADGPVEVALLVRSHPWPRPTPLEEGVTCTVRHDLPLVVAGRTVINPYEPWSSAVLDGVLDVASAVERAAAAELPLLVDAVEREVRGLLRSAGYTTATVDVGAHRAPGRGVRVTVRTSDPVDERVAGSVGAAVNGVVRHRDPYATDVRVELVGGAGGDTAPRRRETRWA